MTALNLGRLETVNLRSAWPSEAGGFTPWLAREENLALLGDTIGIEMALEAQEQSVGPFRADILCKDTRGDWILIENQLERTDHTHLGQLLTYAAGLKTVTIVWIADRFTDEHRAALDWLNEITDDRFSFFGIEIELWKIDVSPIAPRFNVVSKPNNWTKHRPISNVPSETNQLYLEYWTALREHLANSNSFVKIGTPQAQMFATFPVGRKDFYLTAGLSKSKKAIWVQQVIYGPDHVDYFRMLGDQRGEIEGALGNDLVWRERPEGKESQIRRQFNDVDPANKSDWPNQHEAIRKNLESFHAVFSQRVKELDIDEYRAASIEQDE